MPITYTPYRQGNGVDSWIAVETDSTGEVISKYMVFEDPYKKETIRSFEKLTTEEIASFKSIIGITGDGGGGGGSTTIVSGEGIAAIQNMDGSYTINNSAPFPGLSAGNGIAINEDPYGQLLIENTAASRGFTGDLPVFNGKYIDFYVFENGILVDVKTGGGG